MATYRHFEPDVARPALARAAELLRILAGGLGILAAGLLAGFLARGLGDGLIVAGIAAALPVVALIGGIYLAARTLRGGRALGRDGDDHPTA